MVLDRFCTSNQVSFIGRTIKSQDVNHYVLGMLCLSEVRFCRINVKKIQICSNLQDRLCSVNLFSFLPAFEYVNSCSERLMILKIHGNIFLPSKIVNVALLLQVCHEHWFNFHFPFLFS